MTKTKDLLKLFRLMRRIPFEQMRHLYIVSSYKPEELDDLFAKHYWTRDEYFSYGPDPYTESDDDYDKQEEILTLNKQYRELL